MCNSRAKPESRARSAWELREKPESDDEGQSSSSEALTEGGARIASPDRGQRTKFEWERHCRGYPAVSVTRATPGIPASTW